MQALCICCAAVACYQSVTDTVVLHMRSPVSQPASTLCSLHVTHVVQDPSYDPYGYAKVATRTASSEVGAAAACPANVQSFFKMLFTMATTKSGLQEINTQLSLCSDSQMQTAEDVNTTLASFVRIAWTNAVSD